MQVFKRGDYVDIRGLDKEVIDAIEARFRADGWEDKGIGFKVDINNMYRLGISTERGTLGAWRETCTNELTVEECLFAGAPDWAVDDRKIAVGTYIWTDGDMRYKAIGGTWYECHTYSVKNRDVIYTRQKQELRPVADSSNWHERGGLPPVGTECEAKIKGTRSDFRKIKPVFFGNECFIACDITNGLEIHGVISDWTFRPLQPEPKKIDISVFRDTGILMVNKMDRLELYDHDTDLILHPYCGHWNAVKGLTEEPEWCKPFSVTVRFNDGEERNLKNLPCENWPAINAICFDSVKEGFEL